MDVYKMMNNVLPQKTQNCNGTCNDTVSCKNKYILSQIIQIKRNALGCFDPPSLLVLGRDENEVRRWSVNAASLPSLLSPCADRYFRGCGFLQTSAEVPTATRADVVRRLKLCSHQCNVPRRQHHQQLQRDALLRVTQQSVLRSPHRPATQVRRNLKLQL